MNKTIITSIIITMALSVMITVNSVIPVYALQGTAHKNPTLPVIEFGFAVNPVDNEPEHPSNEGNSVSTDGNPNTSICEKPEPEDVIWMTAERNALDRSMIDLNWAVVGADKVRVEFSDDHSDLKWFVEAENTGHLTIDNLATNRPIYVRLAGLNKCELGDFTDIATVN